MILSGPSGVGKDTVIDAWSRVNPAVQRVVAYTTRAPREGETDGVAYHFVSVERFMAMAEAGEFLEWKEVHGNWYATPMADMERMVAEGKIAILKIDVQGALSVLESRPEIDSVFILPPSFEELERRIVARGLDNESNIDQRLQNAREELACSSRYRYRLVNDELPRIVNDLERIFGAQ